MSWAPSAMGPVCHGPHLSWDPLSPSPAAAIISAGTGANRTGHRQHLVHRPCHRLCHRPGHRPGHHLGLPSGPYLRLRPGLGPHPVRLLRTPGHGRPGRRHPSHGRPSLLHPGRHHPGRQGSGHLPKKGAILNPSGPEGTTHLTPFLPEIPSVWERPASNWSKVLLGHITSTVPARLLI